MTKYSLRHPLLGDSAFTNQFFDTIEAALEFVVRASVFRKEATDFVVVAWTDTELKSGTVQPVAVAVQDIVKP